jgi:hypothetical protein
VSGRGHHAPARRPWAAAATLLLGAGCLHPSSGLDERTSALLADYRARVGARWPGAPPARAMPWRSGEFTVHALAADGVTELERVSVRVHPWRGDVRVSLERLGPRTRLRVTLSLSRAPAAGEALGSLVTAAVVRRGDQPDVHHAGAPPPEVLALVERALTRPDARGAPATLLVPAGAFEGCVDGVHGAVPLSGVVRRAEGDVLRELLEFGDDDSGWLL